MAFHFGKYDPDTSTKQQGQRTGHAEDALEKTDHHRGPKEHADKVQGVREREYGKQTTEWTDNDGNSGTWGGSSDDVRKAR